MITLKNELGNHAKVYHIITDSNPRYASGSAGITYYNDALVLIVRQITCIFKGGIGKFDINKMNYNSPYWNNSVCKIGYLDTQSINSNIVYLNTNKLQVLPSGDKLVFKGFEDPRLIVWDDELYTYGTQFTDMDPYGESIMCYKLNDKLERIEDIRLPGMSYIVGQSYTEKNWMAIPDRKLDFITQISIDLDNNPHIILYSDQHSEDKLKNINIGTFAFKGSTPLIKIGDIYYTIVHNSFRDGLNLFYEHMICEIDRDFNVSRVSNSFHFEQPGVEFCTGWCIGPDNKLYITYSTTDGTTNMLVTTMEDLLNVLNGKHDGRVQINNRDVAEQIFTHHPIDAAQYYWKDWIQNKNRDSLYSHYAILLQYLDKYLLIDNLPYLEEDDTVDALVLKLYNHRRTSRDFTIFYDLLKKLPPNWENKISNKHIKNYCFEKLIK